MSAADTGPSSSTTLSPLLRVSVRRSPSQRASTSPSVPQRTRTRRWTRLPPSRLIWVRVGTMLCPRRPTPRTTRGKLGGIKLEMIHSNQVDTIHRLQFLRHFGPDHPSTRHYAYGSACIPLYPYFRRHARLFVAHTPRWIG